jgi:putative ABC transport system permease protein
VTDSFASAEAVALGDSIQLRLNGADTTWQVVGIISGLNPQVYGYLETVSRLDDTLNQTDSVLIRTMPGTDVRSVADDLNTYLDTQHIAVSQIAIRQDVVEGAVGGFNRLIVILLGMAILIGVIAGLGLPGTMSLNVLERTREIWLILVLVVSAIASIAPAQRASQISIREALSYE